MSDELISPEDFLGSVSKGTIRREHPSAAQINADFTESAARAPGEEGVIRAFQMDLADPNVSEAEKEQTRRYMQKMGMAAAPLSLDAPKKLKMTQTKGGLISVDDFLGLGPAEDEANLDTRDIRARTAGPVQPKGFMANLKITPTELWHAWTQESLPANLYHAYKRGVFNRPISELIKSGKVAAENFDIGVLYEEAKKDPGGFGAQLINALLTDPELLLIPAGLGGTIAARLGTTGARIGSKTAAVGRFAGRGAEGAIVGGGLMGSIEGAKQLKERGEIASEDLLAATKLGAELGGVLTAVLGKTPARSPKLGEAPSVFAGEAFRRLREQQEIIDVLSPEATARIPAREGQVRQPSTVEGEVVQPRPALPAPRAQAGSVMPENPVRDIEQFSAADLKALGLTRRELANVLSDGKLPTAKDRVGYLAGLGVGATGAALLISAYQEAERNGVGLLDVLKSRVTREPYLRPGELEQEPQPTPDNTMLGSVAAAAGAFGAVKGKGGMWHPEAVARLSEAISPRSRRAAVLARGEPQDAAALARDAEQASLHTHSDRMVRNYLNKYAGTKEDPLKDVEIPFGEGTKRWEDAWDAAAKGRTARDLFARADEHGYILPRELEAAKPEETIFGLRDSNIFDPRFNTSTKAISDYLSHVGDYLRQNVDPAKLPQYDLVRAVRETAANDARVAKEMEKGQAASMKDLPVYKEYPDGFKWVELKLPEKLTEEQSKLVRKAEIQVEGKPRGWSQYEQVQGYEAIGPDGKPIKNAYTGDNAGGRTPEEAYLAGQLAREGNSMGHCVGGYCEGVASGESRIFSLRDPKGKSHVTIEVSKGPVNTLDLMAEMTGAESDAFFKQMKKDGWITDSSGVFRRKLPEGGWVSASNAEKVSAIEASSPRLADLIKQTPDRIDQIKGKQNRAPVAEYLPYVQDFVRGGKWGEVGDLQNTGLWGKHPKTGQYMTNAEIAELAGVSEKAVDQFGKGTLPLGSKEDLALRNILDTRSPNYYGNQAGKADPKLLAKIAAVGTGAALGAAYGGGGDQLAGAALGAIAAGLGIAIPFGRVGKGAEYALGILSTRIRAISPALMKRARDYEQGVLEKSYDWLAAVDPFLVRLNKLDKETQGKLNRAILTNDGEAIKVALREAGDPELFKQWTKTRELLEKIGSQLRGAGRFKEMVDDYFPRLVRDREGLMKALGGEAQTVLEKKIATAELAAMKSRGSGLSALEESAIINKHLAEMHRSRVGQPAWAKGRRIEEITEAIEPFYASPTESLHAYLRSAANDIERARFFGRDLATVERNGQRHINVEGSIGNVVQRLINEKKIQPSQIEELTKLLESRFGAGELAPNGLVQDFKNLANAGLLGNALSAGTQFGDAIIAGAIHGLRPTLGAVARIVTGRPRVRMKDFGLVDHISEEFVSTRSTAKFLNKIFKYSGFSLVDAFGKNVNLGAALTKYERLAQTAKGVERIAEKYGEMFGPEFPQLVADLRARQLTPNVRSLLFNELSDVQPITRLEMTQGYLDSGKIWGGTPRLAYMLKTFMLKQLDILRREGIQEIQKGNVARGLYNLTRIALIMGAAGATTDMLKDWLMGRPFDAKWTDIPMNLLKTFGWSEYTIDKAVGTGPKKAEPLGAVLNMAVPPFKMMDEIIRQDPSAVKYIPLVGKLYYEHLMGGAEKYQKAKEKREAAAQKRKEKD